MATIESVKIKPVLAGVLGLPEHRTEPIQLVLDNIFIGFGQMGEPIAHILGEIVPTRSHTKYSLVIKHAGEDDRITWDSVEFLFDRDQLKLIRNKSKAVSKRYKEALDGWKNGSPFS